MIICKSYLASIPSIIETARCQQHTQNLGHVEQKTVGDSSKNTRRSHGYTGYLETDDLSRLSMKGSVLHRRGWDEVYQVMKHVIAQRPIIINYYYGLWNTTGRFFLFQIVELFYIFIYAYIKLQTASQVFAIKDVMSPVALICCLQCCMPVRRSGFW